MCAHSYNKDVPHKGWILVDVIDVRDDGRPVEETDYETCMMCGNEKIRYVHIVEHKDIEEQYRLGCICAEKMTQDYLNPRKREAELKNKNNRRINWLKRQWRTSASGNSYLNIDENNVGVFKDAKSGKYKCRINDDFGKLLYNDLNAAKIGLFNKIEELKQKGKWL
jgi:hypothetical protein